MAVLLGVSLDIENYCTLSSFFKRIPKTYHEPLRLLMVEILTFKVEYNPGIQEDALQYQEYFLILKNQNFHLP
ncbi:hypothetical protein L465_00374 [Enterobacter sp. BIDMC 29]|nr:hypothetical protein L465_00374 [Enterobacter sp. BIDMC 29]